MREVLKNGNAVYQLIVLVDDEIGGIARRLFCAGWDFGVTIHGSGGVGCCQCSREPANVNV